MHWQHVSHAMRASEVQHIHDVHNTSSVESDAVKADHYFPNGQASATHTPNAQPPIVHIVELSTDEHVADSMCVLHKQGLMTHTLYAHTGCHATQKRQAGQITGISEQCRFTSVDLKGMQHTMCWTQQMRRLRDLLASSRIPSAGRLMMTWQDGSRRNEVQSAAHELICAV